MKKIQFTEEEKIKVFQFLECNWVYTYHGIEENTGIPKNKLKKITKSLKNDGIIEVSTLFDEGTGLIAGRGFLRKDEIIVRNLGFSHYEN